MDVEHQIERIEAWFANRLNPDEKAKFEEELASNIELQQLVQKHKYFLDGFEGMKVQAFADRMRLAIKPSPLSANHKSLWATISIAATVIILIGITYFIVQPSGTQRIAVNYYAAPMAEISRSDTPGEVSNFQAGMLAFARKDWDAAISSFSQISTTDPDYPRGLYFEAHAHVAAKRYAKALALFDDPVFRNSPLQQQAEWNSVLMLMYLQYPTLEIRDELNRIEHDPDHFYKNKAAELLKELEPD